jgi:hypothetical protein
MAEHQKWEQREGMVSSSADFFGGYVAIGTITTATEGDRPGYSKISVPMAQP